MIERLLEGFLFASRWLLAPFFIILVFSLIALLIKMGELVWHFVPQLMSKSEADAVLATLGLIDLTLTGSLVIVIIFAGYENFVSRIDRSSHKDWPDRMGKIDFTGLKLKLLSTIVAISSIQLLRAFMDLTNVSDRDLGWYVGIHLVFVISTLLLALTDRVSADSHS